MILSQYCYPGYIHTGEGESPKGEGYEFKQTIIVISIDNTVILAIYIMQETDSEIFLTPTAGSSVLEQCGLIGKGVKRPTFEDYRVFVQSTGSGARHLPIGSLVLYEHVRWI